MSTQDAVCGGCACGAVRYELLGKPKFSFFCQCRQCQHLSGTGHSAAFLTDAQATTITGKLQFWDRTAANGNVVSQGFCPTCGSPVLNKNSGMADSFFVNAGTLDRPQEFKPERVLYHDEAQPWDMLDPTKL